MDAVIQLEELMLRVSTDLHMISTERWSEKPSQDKWSKKEILGHLIDSEYNNHSRIVKSLSGAKPLVIESYQQNEWVRINNYQAQAIETIYANWKIHQEAFINLIKCVPQEELSNPCLLTDGTTESLGWLINDYVKHQAHHVNQIFER